MDFEAVVKEIETALTIKVRAGVPFKIVGALLFGSMARGRDFRDSDIDLLVMTGGINPKRRRRGKEVALLKSLLLLHGRFRLIFPTSFEGPTEESVTL